MFKGIAQSASKFVSETLSRQLLESALRKQQMSSSFRRAAKCEITERNAGELREMLSDEKQPPDVFYRKKWS